MGEFSLWRRENPASNCKRQLCCKQIPLAWSDAPNLAQEKSLQLCTSEVIRRFPKGNGGKRVSSGYNRRRRLAPRSSGKQQAERTAVRTAPIVCPEESPLVRPQAHFSCRGGHDAPTTARVGTCHLMGFSPTFAKGRAESPLVRPQAHTPSAPGGA